MTKARFSSQLGEVLPPRDVAGNCACCDTGVEGRSSALDGRGRLMTL